MTRFSILLAFIVFIGCSTTENIKIINSEFENSNYAEGKYVGLVGSPSKIYKSFNDKWNRLNDDEKIELAKNGNLIPKFYASMKLINSKSNKILDVFKENISDDRNITYLDGDVQKPTEISIEMVLLVNQLIENKKKKDSLSVKNSIDNLTRRREEFKQMSEKGEIERPGFLEYLDDEINTLLEFENWTLQELIDIKKVMELEIKKNKKSSNGLLQTI